jgi:hypothetical protein
MCKAPLPEIIESYFNGKTHGRNIQKEVCVVSEIEYTSMNGDAELGSLAEKTYKKDPSAE